MGCVHWVLMLLPRDVLLKLRSQAIGDIALLESRGAVAPFSRYSLLSAAPSHTQNTLPDIPPHTSEFFPCFIGGMTFEGEQYWAYYPSGMVWDREKDTVSVVGEPHMDWHTLISGEPAQLATPSIGELTSNYPRDEFMAGVQQVQRYIREGEVYQVNLSHRLQAAYSGDPLAAYVRLTENNPSPFMAYLEGKHFAVASSSPERLFSWNTELLSGRPIAGTRRRGETPEQDAAFEQELLSSPKEHAEHVMLLDLERNDLGQIAEQGSVWVSEFLTVERYSQVMHLVSEVQAIPRANLTLSEAFAAKFPGGTITGAPKKRVIEVIKELEPSPRGWYTGAIGYVSGVGVDMNILIRTLAFEQTDPQNWTVSLAAGAGIVMDSIPEQEYQETLNKAAALIRTLKPESDIRKAAIPSAPRYGNSWRPAAFPEQVSAKVLLLDNFDSFTYNLVHDLYALGASVQVEHHTQNLAYLRRQTFSHVLIGPGPSTPQNSGITLDFIAYCLQHNISLLGVCLGHQALGEVLGAKVVQAPIAVHGKLEQVKHHGTGLFSGLVQPCGFTRYHSLVLDDLPETIHITARSAEGLVMAIAARDHRAWGVQFHPESVLSSQGRQLLYNWLKL